MGEYQFYEFRAIDRNLTRDEMEQLRSCSSRARITPLSFVNEYHWGSFRGDEKEWMKRYFDAFIYVSNWGNSVFKLRLPRTVLGDDVVMRYEGDRGLTATRVNDKVIITFAHEDEEGGDYEGEVNGSLDRLLPIRRQIAMGDHRALYLGWLRGLQSNEYEEGDREPLVPPGLNELDESLWALVDLLSIDEYLVNTAATASPPLCKHLKEEEVKTWLEKLPVKDKDRGLLQLMLGDDSTTIPWLIQRYKNGVLKDGSTPSRTVGELKEKALQARRHAVVSKENEESARRETYLRSLLGREGVLWKEAEALIETKQQKGYEKAVKIILELRDVSKLQGREHFQERLEELRREHSRKPALIARLAVI